MQTEEKIDRAFEIEINGKPVICAEVHIKRALPDNAHKGINAFYLRLCDEFAAYTEKTLAPEFAECFKNAQTVRERCSLKIPVLCVSVTASGEETLTVTTAYTLFCGARAEKREEIRTDWDADRGIMVKKRANKKGST